ncbi:MAG: polysaccharide export protein [Nitrospinota bacterium]|nr:MAG: polysaccharide export protein [Nitrospinota bacterium]
MMRCKRSLFVFLLALSLSACRSLPSIPDTRAEGTAEEEQQAALPGEEGQVQGFRLGVGDEVKITVWKHDDLNRTLRISPTGKIFYPLVGEIQAAGKGTEDLRRIITDGLKDYITNPQVNVDVTAFRSRKIYVFGEVERPGLLVIEDSLNILDALLLAGGPTLDADQKRIILIHRSPSELELRSINLKRLFQEGDQGQVVTLQGGDIVYVPPSFVANVDRFFDHIGKVLSPILSLERSIILGDEIKRIFTGETERRVIVTR